MQTIKLSDAFHRILVQVENKRTTVSIDGVLYRLLEIKLGSNEAVLEWIRTKAHEISVRPDYNVNKSNIGLSRMIQQQIACKLAGVEVSH